jgi:hypothetical protein
MIVIAEFLMACGVAAIVGSLIYTGYTAGKAKSSTTDKKE